MVKDTDISLGDLADNALLVLFANGSKPAAMELTRRLGPKVFRHAYYRLQNKSDAEDIAQEAFLRLWKIAPDWKQDQAQVSTWLYRVIDNLCIDRLRARRPSSSLDDLTNDPVDPSPSADQSMLDQSRARALHTALAALPERQAQAVRLRHLDNLTNPEIAQIMGLSVEAVESLTARGIRALQAQLHGQKTALGYENDTA